MFDYPTKDLIIEYIDEQGVQQVVYSHDGIDDMDVLAKSMVPKGLPYKIRPRDGLHNPGLESVSRKLDFNSQLHRDIKRDELGYFGNIWVRQNVLALAGQTSGEGHYHHFDHVSLLASGCVRVEVEGFEPKEFEAPTFIIIKKEYLHKFTALTNNCLWYCVFALRDIDGDISDIYSGDNSPYDAFMGDSEKLKGLSHET